MKKNIKIPYFFDKDKSGFSNENFEVVSSNKLHFNDKELTELLDNKIYIYKSNTKNGIVFYFIDCELREDKDLQNLHLKIFSEDKADFYIVKRNNTDVEYYELNYAKTTHKEIETIIRIPVNTDDEELLQTINKTSIDTGLFWIYYKDALKQVQTTNIRKQLVNVLSELRNNLTKEISKFETDSHEKKRNYVQALIDRTLFIKFLEDRHIINSYFYGQNIEYKDILKSKSAKKVNELFTKVHHIFNNYLFNDPTIPDAILTNEVLQIIQNSIEGVEGGQLTLFDLKFDIIPIEAISLIYEIFLDAKQRKDGVYYTPKQLSNLITEETINNKGRIIDPACGSGAFLISAYKRLLELEQKQTNSIIEKIDYRTKLIKEYIFGIEKDETAQRLSVFSLYLSILDGLTSDENEELKDLLKENNNYPLFHENIGENIICKNTFEPNRFDNEKFDFIIGNPPWKKDFEDEDNYAKKYLENNKDDFSGKSELSQLFQHKAKTWEKLDTRYGFVVNTSNFTNEYSKFQDFFYKNFNIEKFYEVSDLNLFTASEPAIVCIYTGKQQDDNELLLNVLKANEFTKLFKTTFILEEDNIRIKQSSLIKTDELENIPLKNYLVGNKGDFRIINYLESKRFEKFKNYILKDEKGECFIHQGVKTYAKDVLPKYFGIDVKKLSNIEIENLKNIFYSKNTSKEKTNEFNYPYITPQNISKFKINNKNIEYYLPGNIKKLRRSGKKENYLGDRIILPNHGNKFKAVFISSSSSKFYPSADLSVLKLNNPDYYFYTAILNSKLAEYYLKVTSWNRLDKGHSRINQDAVPQIPIPTNKNQELVKKIEQLSTQFTNNDVGFRDKEIEYNDLVYDLYGIGIIEKQRINDFFIKSKEVVKNDDLEGYKKEFCEYLSDNIKQDTIIHTDIYNEDSLVKGICIIKIYFGEKGKEYPKTKKVSRYLLLELLKNVSKINILTLRERIYGENTIYIIKDNLKKSWTLTKAGEDAVSELNKINKYNFKKFRNGK